MEKSSGNNYGGGMKYAMTNGEGSPLMLGDGLVSEAGGEYGHGVLCRFVRRFKALAITQITLGILLIAVGLYTHFPIFSGLSDAVPAVSGSNGTSRVSVTVVDRGWRLLEGEDRLWWATWIGCVNLFTGVLGRLATKRSIRRSIHITLRRTYFVLNAFITLYCNGIGIVAYVISLSHHASLITPHQDRRFTAAMAFISLFLIFPLFLLNLVATVYQSLATRQCRCWICDPRNAQKE